MGNRRPLTTDDYANGILAGERTVLARAITLVESNAPGHLEQAQDLLQQLLPHTGNAIRVGITGVPGAGKSTFIEALGRYLIQQGHHVAVLAVDPTSSLTRGSILGDKTRMEELAREQTPLFGRHPPAARSAAWRERRGRRCSFAKRPALMWFSSRRSAQGKAKSPSVQW